MRPVLRLQDNSLHSAYRRIFCIYLGILIGVVITLGVLHYLYADLRIGRVYWFNLDKERNINTWFSGMVFFLYGCAAFVAYYWERKQNSEGQPCFRLPALWLGIGFAGLLMSLDEITILHENLYWREIRHVSARLSGTWRYITQWQILFAPAIIVIPGYFVLFLSNRFSASPKARHAAFAGIGCWLTALFLEGSRGTFKQHGAWWYSSAVILEETMETIGAILLLASIVFYTIDVALDLTAKRRNCFMHTAGFFTARAVKTLAIIFIILSLSGGIIFLFAQIQASKNLPVPQLFLKALQSQPDATLNGGNIKPPPGGTARHKVWFDDIKGQAAISESYTKAIVQFVTDAVTGQGDTQNPFPRGLKREETPPRIIFLSISDGSQPAYVVMGSGNSMEDAVEDALSQTRGIRKTGYKPRWVKLDIVQDVYPANDVAADKPMRFIRSLQGIAFDRDTGVALLPEELTAYALVSGNGRIHQNNISRYLKRRSAQNRSTHSNNTRKFTSSGGRTLYRFSAASFFSDGDGISRLYRGHRLFEQFTREDLLMSARMGGEYLTRSVGTDGRFLYTYRPRADYAPDDYNILRHAGTVYAMLELYEVTNDHRLLEAIRRAIKYLVQSAKPCESGSGGMACIVERGYVKLGGNALAAIALAKYAELTSDTQYMPILTKLGKWIRHAQAEDGRFFIQKQAYPDSNIVDFISQYYPGEALLALVRLYSITKDEGWLDAADKGARYLINVRDRGIPTEKLTHDHWLLYALNELHRYRPDPLYLNHSMRIAKAIRLGQNRNPQFTDYLGSYHVPPRSTPTATRSEGLLAAYRLAKDFGRKEEAQRIMETVNLNIRFQLQTQFRPETVMYVADPQRCLGAFHNSLTNFDIRIDYVQHNISALLALCRILQDSSFTHSTLQQ